MSSIQNMIAEQLRMLSERIVQFLPHLLTAIVILIVGIIAGMVLKWLVSRILKGIGVDRFCARTGLPEMLKRGGVRDEVSALLGKMAGAIVIVVFMIISMRALDLPAIDRVLERFLFYLPNVFAALLIILLGYLISNIAGRAALIASVNAGMKISGIVGKLVKYSIVLLALSMALEHLGLGKETIIVAFAILFGGVILALALAFGLGGRDTAKEYLERKIKGEEKKDELDHL